MTVEPLALPEILLIKPRIFRDDRGRLIETWRLSAYAEHGIGPFVQDNVSVSRRGVLRGLHLQHPHGQAKLASALRGEVFDVAVDVRVGSPNFGRWTGVVLSEENGWQVYIPAGFAHGFLSLSDEVVFSYKCTEYYTPEAEHSIRWNDAAIAIAWPAENPIIAPKDAAAPMLSELPVHALPDYRPPHV